MKWGELEIDVPARTFAIRLKGASSNPLVAAAAWIGDIDYEGLLEVKVAPDYRRALVEFNGKVDSFPAFEMYAALPDQRPQTLFNIDPEPGATALDLPGAADREARGSVTLGLE